jgi:hypothetical protein
MIAKSQDWRQELVEAYPDLFRSSAGALEGAEGSPECDFGWRGLLDRACLGIRAVLQAHGGSFRFTQIKEKYGGLRIYFDGVLSPEATALVEEAIDLAEARAACTCERCGQPGRLFNRGDWLATACAEHARGEPVRVRAGFENFYVVRCFGADGQPTVTCRRYDRETDSFIDVDPTSLGIEDE